jgi:spermidine/putrescine-binding protein
MVVSLFKSNKTLRNNNISKTKWIKMTQLIYKKKKTKKIKIAFLDRDGTINKTKKKFTNYRCRHTIQQGIKKMIKELIKLKLNKKIFYNKKFYRLQYFEYLHKRKLVDNSLKWII